MRAVGAAVANRAWPIFGEQVALTPLIRAPPAPTFSLKGRRIFRETKKRPAPVSRGGP
jgi:hypothetical protein